MSGDLMTLGAVALIAGAASLRQRIAGSAAGVPMTFGMYLAVDKTLRDAVDKASDEIDRSHQGAFGLTPDHITATPEYKKSIANYYRAKAQYEKFLKSIPTKTRKKYQAKAANMRRLAGDGSSD